MSTTMDESVSTQVGNLHLDEVTGEKVSKSELKKRQKQREAEKKKQEKAAAAPPKAEKKKVSAEEEESNLTPNVRSPKMTSIHADFACPSNTTKSAAAKYRSCGRARIQTHTPTNSM